VRRYKVSPEAEIDVREILQFIAQDNPAAAKRIARNLRAAFVRLAAHPGIGHLREDLTDQPLRFWAVYSYLIAYTLEGSRLEIVRVLHGSRDLEDILRED
jgi:plasmid stabilization system protein ParE